MKKIIAMILFIGLFFCGCGEKKTTPQAIEPQEPSGKQITTQEEGKTNIHFWSAQLSYSYENEIRQMIQAFEAQHPTTRIVWTDYSAGEIEGVLLWGAEKNTLPDVMQLAPKNVQDLGKFDALLNMDQYAAEVEGDFIPGAWASANVQDKTLALPWYGTTEVLLYRKGLFEKAGLNPAHPPQTFDQIQEDAQVIREKAHAYGYDPMFTKGQMIEDYAKAGISLLNQDRTSFVFESNAFTSMTEWFQKMFESGWSQKETISMTEHEIVRAFLKDEVAMVQGNLYHATWMMQEQPDTMVQIGVGRQPVGTHGGKIKFSVVHIGVSNQSKQTQAALDFAKWITNAENQTTFAKASGLVLPSNIQALQDPYFHQSTTLQEQVRNVSASQIQKGEALFPPIPQWEKVSADFEKAIAEIVNDNKSISDAFGAAKLEMNRNLY